MGAEDGVNSLARRFGAPLTPESRACEKNLLAQSTRRKRDPAPIGELASLDSQTERTSCLLCGDRAATAFTRLPGPYRVLVCRTCGLGRTVPHPPDAVLRALYESEYTSPDAAKFGGAVETVRRFFVRALARRIARRCAAPGRVLDVGCGDGKLLVALAEHGFQGTGIELNPRVDERLPAGSGIRIFVGTLAEAALPAASFDVVVLRHVLEHLDDPIGALTEIRRLVAPGGTVVIAVPNLASWQARLARDHWFHLDLPRHLLHFTTAALEGALQRTGFRVRRVSHFSYEQNPYGWLQSLFNQAGGRWRALYYQIRAPGSALAERPHAMIIAAATALMPICVALATVESLARAGGAIEVWAEPA